MDLSSISDLSPIARGTNIVAMCAKVSGDAASPGPIAELDMFLDSISKDDTKSTSISSNSPNVAILAAQAELD
jgi:hypothetical protein